jgi:hypothetical protein
MRVVQNPYCLDVVIVDERLAPLGTIHHCTDPLRRLDATPMQFQHSLLGKCRAIGQA